MSQAILQTKKWIQSVVVGLNFCPFAAKEVKNDTIHYVVQESDKLKDCLETFMLECKRLDEEPAIETTVIILTNAVPDFEAYLDLVGMADELIEENDYEGVYQVASFHPKYRFAGAPDDDPANYTNRSIYPMLHILREESVEKAIDSHPDTEKIPERNIKFAREKGVEFLRKLWESSKEV